MPAKKGGKQALRALGAKIARSSPAQLESGWGASAAAAPEPPPALPAPAPAEPARSGKDFLEQLQHEHAHVQSAFEAEKAEYMLSMPPAVLEAKSVAAHEEQFALDHFYRIRDKALLELTSPASSAGAAGPPTPAVASGSAAEGPPTPTVASVAGAAGPPTTIVACSAGSPVATEEAPAAQPPRKSNLGNACPVVRTEPLVQEPGDPPAPCMHPGGTEQILCQKCKIPLNTDNKGSLTRGNTLCKKCQRFRNALGVLKRVEDPTDALKNFLEMPAEEQLSWYEAHDEVGILVPHLKVAIEAEFSEEYRKTSEKTEGGTARWLTQHQLETVEKLPPEQVAALLRNAAHFTDPMLEAERYEYCEFASSSQKTEHYSGSWKRKAGQEDTRKAEKKSKAAGPRAAPKRQPAQLEGGEVKFTGPQAAALAACKTKLEDARMICQQHLDTADAEVRRKCAGVVENLQEAIVEADKVVETLAFRQAHPDPVSLVADKAIAVAQLKVCQQVVKNFMRSVKAFHL